MFIIINSETLTAKDIETLKTLFATSATPTAPAELTAENETNLDQLRQQMVSAEPVVLTPEPAEAPAQEPEKPKRKLAKYPYKRPAGWEPDAEFLSVAEQWTKGEMTSPQAAREANMTPNQFQWWCRKLNIRKRKSGTQRSQEVEKIVSTPEFKMIAVAWHAGIYEKDEAAKRAGLPSSTFYKRAKDFLREIAA